jgi:hypothetical protein
LTAWHWDLEPDGFGIDIVDNRAARRRQPDRPFKWNGANPDLETECGPRTERFFFRSQGFNRDELADLVTYHQSRFRCGQTVTGFRRRALRHRSAARRSSSAAKRNKEL